MACRPSLWISCLGHGALIALSLALAGATARTARRATFTLVPSAVDAVAWREAAPAAAIVERAAPPREAVLIEVEIELPPVEIDAFAPEPVSPIDPAWGPPPVTEATAWTTSLRRPPPPAVAAEPAAASTQATCVEVVPGHNPPPTYPRRARQLGWQGCVVLQVTVDAAGGCVALSIRRSSGHPLLDRAAQQAVRGWRFRGGPGAIEIPIRFVLTD